MNDPMPRPLYAAHATHGGQTVAADDAPPAATTLGSLRETAYRYRTVKQELRENLIRRLRDGTEVFPGVRGYEQTVLPQIIHALLSRHDMLFLGLRGQAKTRMIRLLPGLLDPWIPVIDGLEVPDDPLCPMTTLGRRAIAEAGDETPLRWMARAERFNEKLATPDVTIADLIGEIDLVKHAEGRYLSDESTMHFGLIPRTNRGIFAVNELPDLSPRIQVGLFNVLEERDIQIRGYPVRLALDVCLVFSANPEDYTNRGRIVTPLKDRIGSVIRTHYPATTDQAMQITAENAWTQRGAASAHGTGGATDDSDLPRVVVPPYLHRVIEEAVTLARGSSYINQASGVSVRTSIACLENLVSSAERRGVMTGEPVVAARVSDLAHVLTSTRGKIELLMADDGDNTEDKLVESLLGEAVKAVFGGRADADAFAAVSDQFADGLRLTVGDDVPAEAVVSSLTQVDGLAQAARDVAGLLDLDADDPQMLASAGEFLLEALYVNNALSKQRRGTASRYSR